MSRYRRNSYGFGGYNSGYSLGKNLFRSERSKRSSKYSLENGLAMFVVLFVFLAVFGGKTGQASVVSLTKALTPFIIFIAVIIGLRLIYRVYQHDKLSRTGIFDIDKMSGPEFENRLMVLYKNLGYQVEHTGKSGDLGVDLIIEKGGRKTAIQAKRYHSDVNEAAVQQVYTGKTVHHCDDALIFTNSNFTKLARKVAFDTNVQLCGRNYLIKLLEVERDNLGRSSYSNSRNKSEWVDNAASWLSKKIPLSKDSTIQNILQSNNAPQKEQPPTNMYPQLTRYISNHLSSGEQWIDIKTHLLKIGWKENLINDAFFQVYNSKAT